MKTCMLKDLSLGKSVDSLRELGISIYDARGNLRDLSDALAEMHSSGLSLVIRECCSSPEYFCPNFDEMKESEALVQFLCEFKVNRG